jgi:hypothetical protein
MAWIRRVRTASRATAVQVAESVAGQRRVVAHVGSAHTEAELGLLEAARRLLDDPAQGSFDLRLEEVRSRAGQPLLHPHVEVGLRHPAPQP